MKPFCFVLMPFGRKTDDSGHLIDFDRVYAEVVRPAVEGAEMEPIRTDEEAAGGFIHKAMFERLMLCDYAVADVTIANANVLYELGIRHGVRPHGTVAVFGKGRRLSFDVAPLRGHPYSLDAFGLPENPAHDRKALAERLRACRDPVEDSPLFQLVAAWPRPEVARLKTDVFRARVAYPRACKDKLRAARAAGTEAVAAVERELDLENADLAIIVDLLLSYRAVKAWQHMVDLVPRMPPVLARTVLVREQFGLALNRLDRHDEAERVLQAVIDEYGPSSETNGLLGRVYKDQWEEALKAGRTAAARHCLHKAIDAYLAGFEADWRDAYPGINAVILMEMAETVDPRQAELLPVVRYAAKRRLASKAPDYWDYATLLELAVLAEDRTAAGQALADALAAVREPWEPEATARSLRLIREARDTRGRGDTEWISALETELKRAASQNDRAGI